ncbi:transcriptional regulator TraR [Neorhizobium sp. NCHU2750]|uniref:autoinducer-binding transcriptional regulator TraR n=1 Tax=Neorhizobium sp. NCHU2750 TaxID=1825976 RepID=UPI000EB615E3|nr:transcriptional regulator TraR [Neorhizobium sp. NCHU2750]
MDQLIGNLLDLSAVVRSQATLKTSLATLAEKSGFSGYGFLNLRPGDLYAISNFQEEWQMRYFHESLRFMDPRVRQARKQQCAFVWTGDPSRGQLSGEDKRFYAEAARYGIRSGISIPVPIANGALAILTFASSEPVQTKQWRIDSVAAASAAAQLHMLIGYLRVTPSVEEQIYLSPKEATYARWLELGKTVEDTALIEAVKYNTVRISLAEVRRRYDLCNNTQLVALAIRRKLI